MQQEQEHTTGQEQEQKAKTSKRGFAAMSPEKQREIAGRGGKAAHQKGTAHKFTTEEARAAGRKGGESVSKNREHMAEIGRRGGKAGTSRQGRNADENDSIPQGDNAPAETE